MKNNDADQQIPSSQAFLLFIFGSLFLLSGGTFAARIELPVQDVQKVVLDLGAAHVRFMLNPQKHFSVDGLYDSSSGNEGNYIAVKEGDQVHIRLKEEPLDWGGYSSQKLMKGKKLDQLPLITVMHPVGIPIELNLSRGRVEIEGWNGNKDLSLIDGELILTRSNGNLKLMSQNLIFKGSDLIGNYEAFVYRSKGQLDNFQGELDWHQFEGSLNLSQIEGRVSMEGFETFYSVQKSQLKGRLKMEKGHFHLSQSSGKVEGTSNEGEIVLNESKEGLDIQLSTQSASVKINTVNLASKKIRLKTGTGDLYLPRNFKVQRGLLEKTFRQNPENEEDSGQILIQSVDGSIFLK